MKRLIIFFIVLLIAVCIGLFMHADPGYVLIAYKSWSLETTLWVLLLAILILYLILHLLAAGLRGTRSISRLMRLWSAQKHSKKSRKQTNVGLVSWLEGKWSQAEKQLTKAAKHSETPLINYLIAARMAQRQGKYDKRDTYLRKAHKSTAGVEVAVGLTQAQLQLEAKQLEQALATLMHIKQLVPKHVYVMKLLQQVYVKLHDWKNLQKLLPLLRKHNVFSVEKLAQIEQQTYLELLATTSDIWAQIPTKLQNNPNLLAAYTTELIKHKDQHPLAEKLLSNALKKSWDNDLITNYGLITDSNNPTKQLKIAELWLKTHAKDPALLLCLGRLCKYQRLWGKAQNYLEAYLTLDSHNPIVYYELGQLMELMGHKNTALDYYRQGLQP